MTGKDEYRHIGGLLCLDFTNTVGPRVARPDKSVQEYLRTFADLVSWSEHAGTVGGNRARLLRRRSDQDPDGAHRAVVRAKAVRETVYAVFEAIANGEAPARRPLADLQTTYTEAMSRAELTTTDDGLDWSWNRDRQLECLIWPIVRSAVDTVTTADYSRIKQCGGHDGSCGWLFYDTSRNGLRRWCSMQACGTWEKTRHRRTVTSESE